MDQPLKGTRIAVLIENTYQDLEFWYPTLRLRAAGAEVQVVGESAGKAYTGSHGYPAQAGGGSIRRSRRRSAMFGISPTLPMKHVAAWTRAWRVSDWTLSLSYSCTIRRRNCSIA